MVAIFFSITVAVFSANISFGLGKNGLFRCNLRYFGRSGGWRWKFCEYSSTLDRMKSSADARRKVGLCIHDLKFCIETTFIVVRQIEKGEV